jgi:hypothetical protein
MSYLAPAEGGVLIDASCGTGLFTRLFARSQRFKGVVALDFRWGLWFVSACVALMHVLQQAYLCAAGLLVLLKACAARVDSQSGSRCFDRL